MARNYAALPHEYINEFADLTHEEIGRLVCALMRYSATGEEQKLDGNERFLWRRVMAQEDRFQESYEEIAKSRSEAARKAAKARWSMRGDADACRCTAPDSPDANTNTETETHTETNTETHTLPSIEGELMARPTAEEVASYARERGSSVDPERFVDYYASRGWKLGTTPMEDWRAAFRNWEREESARSRASPFSQKATDSPSSRPYCTPVDTGHMERTMAQLAELRQQMCAWDDEPPRNA